MGKMEQNREKKRRAILQAAEEIFLSEGYVDANMDHISALAQVTKQTVYRYYPSKIELFKATLQQMGQSDEMDFLSPLQLSDTKEALYQFAYGFIQAHLSQKHLSTYRLLIADSAKAPEIVKSFFDIGPNDTDRQLKAFFSERLGVEKPDSLVQLWTGMLLSHRSGILVGMPRPDDKELEQYAQDATDFLLSAVA